MSLFPKWESVKWASRQDAGRGPARVFVHLRCIVENSRFPKVFSRANEDVSQPRARGGL